MTFSRATRLACGLLLSWPSAIVTAQPEKPKEPVIRGEIAITYPLGPKLGPGARIVAGPGGEVWFQSTHAVARWNGTGLDPSPVKELPHPRWSARSAPPWNGLRGSDLITLPGRDGSVLVVAFRDLYQDVARDHGAKADDHWAVRGLVQPRIDAGAPLVWLEGWLFASGRWVGPLPIDQLVRQERQALVHDFDVPTPETRAFDLQSDVTVLWYAYGGRVGAIPPDGRLRIRKIPWTAEAGRSYPPMNLIRRPDGTIWCTSSTKDGFRVLELKLAGGEIEGESVERASFAAPGARPGVRAVWPWLYQARSGQVVMDIGGPREIWNARPIIHLLGDSGWTRRDDLGRLAFEDDDGSLWFLPGESRGRGPERNAFRKVKGSETTPVLAGDYRWSGPVTRLSDGRLIAPAQWRGEKHLLVVIDRAPAGSPGRWTIREHYAIPFTDTSRAFAIDRFGHLIGPSGGVGELPDGLR
jgi:hypothetical protein